MKRWLPIWEAYISCPDPLGPVWGHGKTWIGAAFLQRGPEGRRNRESEIKHLQQSDNHLTANTVVNTAAAIS